MRPLKKLMIPRIKLTIQYEAEMPRGAVQVLRKAALTWKYTRSSR